MAPVFFTCTVDCHAADISVAASLSASSKCRSGGRGSGVERYAFSPPQRHRAARAYAACTRALVNGSSLYVPPSVTMRGVDLRLSAQGDAVAHQLQRMDSRTRWLIDAEPTDESVQLLDGSVPICFAAAMERGLARGSREMSARRMSKG
jgi:hypothetical protein